MKCYKRLKHLANPAKPTITTFALSADIHMPARLLKNALFAVPLAVNLKR